MVGEAIGFTGDITYSTKVVEVIIIINF